MTTALAARPANGASLAARLAPDEWTQAYLDTIRQTFAKGCTDLEFALGVQISKATGLKIENHELHIVKRNQNDPAIYIIGIAGFYAIAHASGLFGGIEGPFYCGKDGVYTDTWLDDKLPVAAKFTTWRKDIERPFTAVILLSEFRNNSPFWQKSPVNQSGVRAATHSFRKSFRSEIDERQAQARALGASLAVESEDMPGVILSDADDDPRLPATEAPRLVSPAPAPDTGESRHLPRWRELCGEAQALGVTWQDLLPDALAAIATDAQLVTVGPQLRDRIDAAKADAPVMQGRGDAPGGPPPDPDAPAPEAPDPFIADMEASKPGIALADVFWLAELWEEWELVSASALRYGEGSTKPAPDSNEKELTDAIAALEARRDAAKAAKGRRK